MSEQPVTAPATPAARPHPPHAAPRGSRQRPGLTGIVIIAATAIALALRIYQLSRPGYLFGVTEYDDGTDFGSAIMLAHGSLPYRDFIMVQPPGITVLMTPVALIAKGMGTAAQMAAGRLLTALAGTAATTLAGLLVRHRGLLAVVISCGILAVYPPAVQSAHTVLLEPWAVLFCLLGALAVFDGDRFASTRRLAWGGAAFGFAGAVKVWAIIPVVVIAVLCARQPRRALSYLAGVAAGFAIPVLPFVLLAPRTFYNSVIVAQLVRSDPVRTSLDFRLHEMTGLTDISHLGITTLAAVSVLLAVLVAGCCVLASAATRRRPPLLEQFALASCALTIVSFLWPADFYYHYAGFLAPFLALAIALPAARLLDGLAPAAAFRRPVQLLPRYAAAVAVLAVLVMTVSQAASESTLRPTVKQKVVAEVRRDVPAGACVLSDSVSMPIAADRMLSTVPGCARIVDGVGTDYSMSHGHSAAGGAQNVPAVRAFWMSALRSAQYVWLSPLSYRRIPWTAHDVSAYFSANFARLPGGPKGLYIRKGMTPR